MPNKTIQNRYSLYIIAQCLILFNCFLCFLDIYASKLIPYSYVIVGIALILFFLSGVFKKFKFSTLSITFICLFSYFLLSDALNSNFSTFTTQMCLSSFALFFCFSFFAGNKGNLEKSIKCVFGLAVILGTTISVLSLLVNNKSEEGYLVGVVTQWNSLAAYSLVAIICSLLFIDKKNIFSKSNIILGLVIAIDFYTIIKAHSRTPLMVLMVFSIILLFFFAFNVLTKKISKKLIIFSFVIICLFICIVVSIFILKKNAISNESMTFINLINRISSNRINIWKVCLSLFKESPLIGINNNYYDEVLSSYFGYGPSPHNVYISLMTINGLPSLLIYLFIIVYSILSVIRLIRNYDNEGDKRRIYYYMAILCGLLVGDLFECFSIRSYMPSAYIIILVYAAIEMERITTLKNK